MCYIYQTVVNKFAFNQKMILELNKAFHFCHKWPVAVFCLLMLEILASSNENASTVVYFVATSTISPSISASLVSPASNVSISTLKPAARNRSASPSAE